MIPDRDISTLVSLLFMGSPKEQQEGCPEGWSCHWSAGWILPLVCGMDAAVGLRDGCCHRSAGRTLPLTEDSKGMKHRWITD